MGLYFRKSVSLGKGFRLNFSKRGVGVSGGIKGMRLSTGPSGSRATFSIPGTGIYYTKKLGGSSLSRSSRSTSNRSFPYEQTVTNEYTGETRTLRASTSWELRSLVENENERQKRNELRQRQIDNANTQRETATTLTRQVEAAREEIDNILRHTLQVDDRLNWDNQLMSEDYPSFSFEEKKSENIEQRSKIKKLFHIGKKSTSTIENDDAIYESRKAEAYKKYLEEKELHEKHVRENNAEILFLKENFEELEETAIEKYASIILSNSQYPEFIDLDFDVEYLRHQKELIVNCILPTLDVLPIVERYTYNQRTENVEEHMLSSKEVEKLYKKVIELITIRTIHELFEAIYNNSVETIVFNGMIPSSDLDDTDTQDFHCLISAKASKEDFLSLDLSALHIDSILSQMQINRVSSFTDSNQSVTPISE